MLLRDMVPDGQYPNLLVDPAWRDTKHPIEKPRPLKDAVGLRRPAPNIDVEESVVLNYLELGGNSGEYSVTGNSDSLDVTGDIDLIAYVAPDSWRPASNYYVIARYDVADFSYALLINNTGGQLVMQWSPDGSTNMNDLSTVSPTAAANQGLWIRATLDVDNGAGGHTSRFYVSNQPPDTARSRLTWGNLGSPVVTAGTTSIYNGSGNLEIGSRNEGLSEQFAGKIYRGYVLNGIGGTLVADFNPSDADEGDTSFVSSTTGESYAVQGDAAIVKALLADRLFDGRQIFGGGT